MTPREKALEKIAKLRALAADDGATEGEVANAIDHIRILMEDYDLTEEDVDVAGLRIEGVDLGRSRRQLVDNLVQMIAMTCGCTAVLVRADRLRIEYAGPDPMPTIATYLHEVCYRAVEALTAEFKRTPEYRRRRKPRTRREAVRMFQQGVVHVLGQKLRAMAWIPGERVDQLKMAYRRKTGAVTRGVAGLPGVSRSRARNYMNDAASGVVAGRSVDLNAPVASREVPAIGRPER
jgi:hypothetical protein